MNIIDISKLLNNNKSIIICVDNYKIFFAKFENNTYFICETDFKGSYETLLASWHCNEMMFENTKVLIQDNIILAIVQQDDEIIIRKLIKNKQCLEFEKKYNIKGNILDRDTMLFIDENTIIIFLKEILTCEYDGFMCDLREDKNYYIHDRVIVDSLKENFKIYSTSEQKYILFEEVYMTYNEKEEIYTAVKNKEVVIGDCFESIGIIKLNDFIKGIKEDQPNILLKIIESISTNGWIRYLGMNKSHIYYRAKDFETKIEKIYSVDKLKFKKKVIMEINHKKDGHNIKYIYMPQNIQVFKITDDINIKGVFNSTINTDFDCKMGDVVNCIDNKIMVYENILEKTINIKNIKKNETSIYKGRYCNFNENILFVNSES